MIVVVFASFRWISSLEKMVAVTLLIRSFVGLIMQLEFVCCGLQNMHPCVVREHVFSFVLVLIYLGVGLHLTVISNFEENCAFNCDCSVFCVLFCL